MADIAIEARDLIKRFGRDRYVIDGLSLTIKKGELFCLIGNNGAGKTTLIKILCGLVIPTRGKLFISGYDMLKDSENAKNRIGLVTGDERSFYWRLTGKENMDFFAVLYGIGNTRERESRINYLFKLLGIDEPNKRFQEYSSGIKQKLSIARALLNKPDILFMDEITKSLDPGGARELRRFIREELVQNQKKTVFFSTHQLHEAEELADRIAFMSRGRIVNTGTIHELKRMAGKENADMEEIYDYLLNKED